MCERECSHSARVPQSRAGLSAGGVCQRVELVCQPAACAREPSWTVGRRRVPESRAGLSAGGVCQRVELDCQPAACAREAVFFIRAPRRGRCWQGLCPARRPTRPPPDITPSEVISIQNVKLKRGCIVRRVNVRRQRVTSADNNHRIFITTVRTKQLLDNVRTYMHAGRQTHIHTLVQSSIKLQQVPDLSCQAGHRS